MADEIMTEEKEKEEVEKAYQEVRDEEFADVFDKDSALEHLTVAAPVVEEEKKVEVVEKVEDEPKVEPEDELSPTQQAKFNEVEAEKNATEYRLKQMEQRFGSLENKYGEAVKIASKLKDAPTREQLAEAIKDSEKWAELVEDYPSFDVIDRRFANTESKLKAEIDGLKSQMGDIGSRNVGKTEAELTEEKNESVLELRKYYPDHLKTWKSEEFQGWLAKSPPHIKIMSNSNSVKDAAQVLWNFDQDMKEPTLQDTRNERLNLSAESPKGHNPREPVSKSDDELSYEEMREREFDKEYAKE